MKPITKTTSLNYLVRKSQDLESSLNEQCFFVLGIDARELIGTVHFLWCTGILNDKEREDWNNIFFRYKQIAEKNANRSF